MLDVHNHVLFGLDDGCATIEDSVRLAELARAAGHVGIVATPHIRLGMFANTPEIIRRRRDEARPILERTGLELHLGAEYYFDETVLPAAKAKSLLTLGETSRYVLIELPQLRPPPRFGDVLFEIRLAGYVPVIAHPERCGAIQADATGMVDLFRRVGVLLQLDLGSLVGHYGRPAKSAAVELVKKGAYHVAACDLHKPSDVDAIVAPSLAELRGLLKKRKLEDKLSTLVLENPRRILQNRALEEIVAV